MDACRTKVLLMDACLAYTSNYGRLVTQGGLEPPTYSLEGSCSIQLSYWANFGPVAKRTTSSYPVELLVLSLLGLMSGRGVSNPRPSVWKTDALTS